MRILDLFCGAGGASMGYHRAFPDAEIIGVDNKPQPNYPFKFIQDDWATPLTVLPGIWERSGEQFIIHASPPCQHYSSMTKRWARQEDHPDLIGPVRDALMLLSDGNTLFPWVIENVPQAPLWESITLCGSMFNLHSGNYHLRRHRKFESNMWILPPGECQHKGQALGVYGKPGGSSKRDGLKFASFEDWKVGMGITWMTVAEMAESIPPTYTEHIGLQLKGALG